MIFFFIKFNENMNSGIWKWHHEHTNSYNKDVKGPVLRLLTSVLFYFERRCFQTLCTHLQLTPLEPLKIPVTDKTLDTVSKGKIKYVYVCRYVIAKLKHSLSGKICERKAATIEVPSESNGYIEFRMCIIWWLTNFFLWFRHSLWDKTKNKI